jgi:DNA replication protein DnaC
MRTVDDAIARAEPELTERDEVVERPCTRCGVGVSVTIPAGSSEVAAKVMRSLGLVCEPCGVALDREADERERSALRREHERTCGLAAELRGLTFDSYDTSRKGAAGAKRAALAWSRGEHEKPGVMLVGGIGVGKTRLAATALWALLDRRPCGFVNVPDLIIRMGAGFGDRAREDALKTLTGKDALVLDDLDKIAPSLSVLSHLYTAIDGRLRAGAPLFVTTNVPPAKLLERLARPGRGDDEEQRRVTAEAIHSRLLGHCTVHGIQGEDGRRA